MNGRNPDLLSLGKLDQLNNNYGHRVIWIPGHPCPTRGEKCSRCGTGDIQRGEYSEALAPNPNEVEPAPDTPYFAINYRKGYHYHYPNEQDYSDSFIYGEDMLLSARWLTSTPQLTINGQPLIYERDWQLDGRRVLLDSTLYGAEVVVSYRAYCEDMVSIQHVSTFGGNKSLVEEVSLRSYGQIEEGGFLVSIGPQASCYKIGLNDLILQTDNVQTFDDILDLKNPVHRATHRWVIGIEGAWITHQGEEAVLEGLDFDFLKKRWIIPAGLPKGVRQISVRYQACPLYVAYKDAGEARTPYWAPQSKFMFFNRLEQFV
jgi:hypothetical protein